jgi:hypothetical protein
MEKLHAFTQCKQNTYLADTMLNRHPYSRAGTVSSSSASPNSSLDIGRHSTLFWQYYGKQQDLWIKYGILSLRLKDAKKLRLQPGQDNLKPHGRFRNYATVGQCSRSSTFHAALVAVKGRKLSIEMIKINISSRSNGLKISLSSKLY